MPCIALRIALHIPAPSHCVLQCSLPCLSRCLQHATSYNDLCGPSTLPYPAALHCPPPLPSAHALHLFCPLAVPSHLTCPPSRSAPCPPSILPCAMPSTLRCSSSGHTNNFVIPFSLPLVCPALCYASLCSQFLFYLPSAPPCTQTCPSTVLALTANLCPPPALSSPQRAPTPPSVSYSSLLSPAIRLALPSAMACPCILPSSCSFPVLLSLLSSVLPVEML